MTALQDARGCLTPAGRAAVQEAPVGQAPPELARHLAGCARCQERLLAAAAGAVHGGPGAPRLTGAGEPGRLWRPVVFIAAALLFALGALALVGLLARG